MSVLQASGIIKLLRPWHANIGKRLIKSPKLYFLDTGLACFLLGIHKSTHLRGHPLRGALFETFAVSEACKQQGHAGYPDQLWFYRDSNGNEVDLLSGHEAALSGWEIKAAMTVSSDFFKGLDSMERVMGPLSSRSVIYAGNRKTARQRTDIIPWKNIAGVFLRP